MGRAQVPEAVFMRYSTDLRGVTAVPGSYSKRFSHYEEVPEHVAQQIVAAYEKAKAQGE